MKISKKVIIILIIIVGFGISLFLLSRYSVPEQDYTTSVYNSYPMGTRAFYLLLKESGLKTEIIKSRFKDRLGDGTLIMTSFTERGITKSELEYLEKWLAKGNNLIYLHSYGNYISKGRFDLTMLKFMGLSITHRDFKPTRGSEAKSVLKPVVPTRFVPKESQVSLRYTYEYSLYSFETSDILYSSDSSMNVYIMEKGEGRVVFFPSDYPITNKGLTHGDNLHIILHLLRNLTREGTIMFDEFHHNPHAITFRLSLAQRRSIGYGFLLLVLAFLLFVFSGYKKYGRIYKPVRTRYISVKTYVKSLANLYLLAKKDREVLKEYYDLFIREISKKTGVKYRKESRYLINVLKARNYKHTERLRELDGRFKKIRNNPSKREVVRFIKKLEKFKKNTG